MTSTHLKLAAVVLPATLALSACGGGSAASDSTGDSGSASSAKAGRSLADNGSAVTVAPEAASPAKKAAGADRPAIEKAAIISTGTVSLRAKDMDRAGIDVREVVDRYAGKMSEERSGGGYARLVVRIPAASFTRAMADLAKIGHLVTSSVSSKDVSTEVIDVDERVKSARASLDRIRALLTRAERIGDVITIESELAQREADLNSLLGQQAYLGDQTALSTITVTVQKSAAATHHRSSHGGFLTGIGGGWSALRGFGTGLATVVGALLPWVPVVLAVGVPTWLVLRRRRPGPAA